MNANEIREALRKKYSDSRRYAIAEEVGLTTGFSYRRLDMMVLDCYNSNGFRIDGFEIKVSTSDLRRELEDPDKHVAFFDVIDYYTLAVPAGVVEPLIGIIPQNWGILIINESGTTRWKRRPLALRDERADRPVPRGFLASITRAIQSRQPSIQELENQYERGLRDGEEQAERKYRYMKSRVAMEADKLEAYYELERRFELWGHDINKVMDEFEKFRKLDMRLLMANIEATIKKLQRLSDMIGEGDEEAMVNAQNTKDQTGR